MKSWLWRRSVPTVQAWSGLLVPAEIKMVSERELGALVDAAQRDLLGWDANGIVPGEGNVYFVFPYSYEERLIPLWKCRLVTFEGGLSVTVGKGKAIRYGRLDISLANYRGLRAAPRKVERQLLHWLAWKASAASWKPDGEK